MLDYLEKLKYTQNSFNPSPIAVIHHFLFFSKLEASKRIHFCCCMFLNLVVHWMIVKVFKRVIEAF